MQIVGIFCDDLRAESAGTETIVGAFPDNMAVPKVPIMVPKVAVYVRIVLEPDDPPLPVQLYMDAPWGRSDIGSTAPDLAEKTIKDSNKAGLPLAGMIMRAWIAPFKVEQFGLIKIVALVGGQERICGVLNIVQDDSISANASAQPSSQSQPDASPSP